MILSDGSIRDLINKNELQISPLNESQIQPASVDCTLGTHFLKIDDSYRTHLDFESEIKYTEMQAKKILSLPIHQYLTNDEILHICETVNNFFN